MAKLPTVRRLLKEDFPDAPDWIDRLLYTLNLFFESVYSALNRNLTFPENVRSQIKTFRIVAGAAATNNTFSFILDNTWKPQGMIKIAVRQVTGNYTPLTSAIDISWRVGDENNLVIDAITGLTSGQSYDFTVLII